MEKLLKFTQFYHKFQQTKRLIYATGENRHENDSEHSFQVALTCWYLISRYQLNLNLEKVLKYAIIHDLPEVFAGDFYFDINSKKRGKKEALEKEAIKNISKRFPEYSDLSELLESYNSQSDKEAKFVNSVEKLIPVINIYLDNGRIWKEEGMKMKTIFGNRDRKINSDIPKKLWEELKPIIANSGLLK
ncbi:HD domain-containing protein [Candidatus Dojkabacteria bacterium]|nr:HD domain-containing protein [Candidatus Dojkabacteria bacterium]